MKVPKKHHQICSIHTWKLVNITGQFYRCPSINDFCGACIYEIDVHPNLIFFFFIDGNIVPIVIVVVRRILIRIIIGKPWKKEQKKGELNWWIEQNSHNCQTINWPTCYYRRQLAAQMSKNLCDYMFLYWLHWVEQKKGEKWGDKSPIDFKTNWMELWWEYFSGFFGSEKYLEIEIWWLNKVFVKRHGFGYKITNWLRKQKKLWMLKTMIIIMMTILKRR